MTCVLVYKNKQGDLRIASLLCRLTLKSTKPPAITSYYFWQRTRMGNSNTFLEHIKIKLQIKAGTLSNFAYDYYFQRLRWKGYINKRKHEDNCDFIIPELNKVGVACV